MNEDLVSRQAAIDALGKEPEVWSGKDEYEMGLNNQWHYDIDAIKALPSAQPKKGWWVYNERYDDYRCTVCGQHALGRYNYCPDCGAKMDIEYPPKDFMNQPEGEAE